MAVMSVLFLRTQQSVCERVQQPAEQQALAENHSALTYEASIYPHCPRKLKGVTMLAEIQTLASRIGRSHPFPALLYCSNRTWTKALVNFRTAPLIVFLLFITTTQEKGSFSVVWQKKIQVWQGVVWKKKRARWMMWKGRDEEIRKEEWGQKRYWKRVVGRYWIECMTNKWWAPSLDSNVIGYTSQRHYPQYSWHYRGVF